jgi:hypothetical protein
MSNKKSGGVYALQMSQYSQPTVKENRTEDWVDIMVINDEDGTKERYFDYLIKRYRNSATNNAVLNNIFKAVYGTGLTATDASRRPSDYARMKTLFSADDLRSVIVDYCVLGTGAFQVIIEKGELKSARHIPRNLLNPAKCNEDGEIDGYFYSDDWSNVREYKPKRIDLLTNESKNGVYLVVFGSYSIGRKYVFSVDYEGALDYALLEEKIAEFQINDANNGFTPTTIINYNNGVTDVEAQKAIVRKTEEKTTGVNGKRTLVSFNSNKESEVTVQQLPLNDAPSHYEYLSKECTDKILAGHNVVSSMLVGIAKDGQGFASTADEIEIASYKFYADTIAPKQEVILQAIEKILAWGGITLNLGFGRKKLVEEKAQDTQLSMSAHDEELSHSLISKGEEMGEEWVLVDSRKVDYDDEDRLDAEIEALNNPKKNVLAKLVSLVSTGTARPNAKSEQDNAKFKTRYRYAGQISDNSRLFCRKMLEGGVPHDNGDMMSKKVYRKEDLIAMGSQEVNEVRTRKDGTKGGWGAEGATTYSIWLYKGGGACHHYFIRETYARRSDVNNPNAEIFTPAQQRKEGFIAPVNDSKVYQKPKDMPNQGFLTPRG